MVAFDRIGDLVDEFECDGAEFALTWSAVEVEFRFVLSEDPVDGGLKISDGLLPEDGVATDELVGIFRVVEIVNNGEVDGDFLGDFDGAFGGF